MASEGKLLFGGSWEVAAAVDLTGVWNSSEMSAVEVDKSGAVVGFVRLVLSRVRVDHFLDGERSWCCR